MATTATTTFLSLLSLSLFFFLLPTSTQNPQSFTSVLVSQRGLDFLKDILIDKALSSITLLHLPKIQRSVKIPFLGGVEVVLSNITIYEIGVPSSYIKPGDTGVAIVASGTTCNLSMEWYYSYGTWLVPIEISDEGSASVKVEGMEIGLTLGLDNDNGTLKLSLMDCGCYVKDISIKLDGGASWLYQGIINAFKEELRSAVETAITQKLKEGILKLDSFIESLPEEIPVDDNAALNMTFVNDPFLSNSSIGFDINGLFTARGKATGVQSYYKNSQAQTICSGQMKMLGISVDEAVFNSASALYYDADFMKWIVDNIPDQSLLNTAGWRFIIPHLYKKYPNDPMNLNITLSSAPVIRISEANIGATFYVDLVIDVLEADQVIPVACISLEILGSGLLKVTGNNLGGSVKLKEFSMSLKWSKIGNLHMYLIQPVMWTLIQTVFVPYANSHLSTGFPLPIVHGFTLQGTEIIISASEITVCSDVIYVESNGR